MQAPENVKKNKRCKRQISVGDLSHFTPFCVENAQMSTLPSFIYARKVGALNEKRCKELFKKSYWLKNVEVNDETYPHQCIGGCGRTSKSIKLTYFDEKRNLCFDCFIDKNDELAKKI